MGIRGPRRLLPVMLVGGALLLGWGASALADVNAADDTLILVEEDDASLTIEIDEGTDEGAGGENAIIVTDDEAPDAPASAAVASASAGPTLRLDRVRLEYAPLLERSEHVDAIGLAQAELSLNWSGSGPWEGRIAARADGFAQAGGPEADEVTADYGETYVRYRSEALRVTLGAQQVIWGRIDEIPPTDRLSVQDLTRFILDDLPERRRARPMLRIEGFTDAGKLDLLLLPTFRGAELPDKDSIWYPVDRRRGEILGIAGNPLLREVVRNARIDDDAPDSDDGVGLRFSRSRGSIDWAVTAQHGRQSVPYFEYQAARNVLRARYPHATTLGADIGIEAGGMLWRAEVAWVSDVPVTRRDYRYDTVEALNWALGMEFYPGDGDARVNLQLAAMQLRNADGVFDRDRIYNLNGSVAVPFAEDRWRASVRFFAGLDRRDVYVNPELAFVGWEPHTLYVEMHWFDGSAGTLGGFHEDHGLIAFGWRARF